MCVSPHTGSRARQGFQAADTTHQRRLLLLMRANAPRSRSRSMRCRWRSCARSSSTCASPLRLLTLACRPLRAAMPVKRENRITTSEVVRWMGGGPEVRRRHGAYGAHQKLLNRCCAAFRRRGRRGALCACRAPERHCSGTTPRGFQWSGAEGASDYSDGKVKHFEGARGQERVVRVEENRGVIHHYEGARGQERKVHRSAWTGPRTAWNTTRAREARSGWRMSSSTIRCSVASV